MFYAFFGLGWLLAGLGHFGGAVTGAAGTLGLAVAVALVLTARRQIARRADPADRDLSPEQRERFRRVNIAQWLMIALILGGCAIAGDFDLAMPLVAVAVGVHFLPLADVFGDRRLVVPGAALFVSGLVGVLAWVGHAATGTITTEVGLGCAVTLWATAVWSLLSVSRPAPAARPRR
ncbi:hypothetical protein GCM10009839_80760 [Catenulispora yoronensis]|uniref:Uncharacterized protein n=1 Tax=Catenulispora yoronensis TaxID=450799 RepID=A0ABN2VC00_9ACTN